MSSLRWLEKLCSNHLSVVCVFSFLITAVIIFSVFILLNFAPFGERSLVYNDAYYQYTDFFSFLKDVISNKNDITYTFSNNLGGSYIGQFAYYLSSPLNFFIIFFSKYDLQSFYDIITALKICISSFAFAYYSIHRFNNRLKPIFVILLSIGYGLMAYTLQQACNTMWLDGVYMLPLILLGVYRTVSRGDIVLLAISVGLSILFNWYTAGINCIFACIWFIIECLLIPRKKLIRRKKDILISFCAGMLIGLLISMVLFLPTIIQLRQGVGSAFDWKVLSFHRQGSIISTLGSFYMGMESTSYSAGLYTGCLSLLGVWGLVTQNYGIRKKILVIFLLLFVILLFHLKFFFFLFSLLKIAPGYEFRYSYVGCFVLLFLGAVYFSSWDRIVYEKKQLLLGIIPAIFLFVFNYIKPNPHPNYLYVTIAIWILLNGVLFGIKKYYECVRLKVLLQVCLVSLVIIEMGLHTFFIINAHESNLNASGFKNYTILQQEQIDRIKALDSSSYRIMQTLNRENMFSHSVTSIYNESVAFNYWGIGGYTSVPRNEQMTFLENLGYRKEHLRMNIVTMPIIPADALLGVKYILSWYPISNLTIVPEIKTINQKDTYLNPYALPLAFVYDATIKNNFEDRSNPFVYTNSLYSEILGHSVSIYKPLSIRKSENGGEIDYNILSKTNKNLFYGDIQYKNNLNGMLDVNDKYVIPYGGWITPSVFYIPVNEQQDNINIKLKTKERSRVTEEEFYYMDHQVMADTAKEIQKHEAKNLTIENGHIYGKVNGKQGQRLFLSVPVDSGWDIKINGKTVNPKPFAGCLMTLPLIDGVNDVQMIYHIPGLNFGIALSIMGWLLLGRWQWKRSKKEK